MADSVTEQLRRLELRVELLLAQCARLREENQVLRASQENLVAERASLLEKTATARARVEAMIGRLRALEQHS
ncbi:MAG TPA: TIGR02449 family protein [Gammaproteobacteria bacterium]|nr:TIGR02449 family protein [Gammaproteobacteria bacterium]